MRNKYQIKHAASTAFKWKVVAGIAGGLVAVSLIVLGYLYFPMVSGYIKSGVKYLFKPPEETVVQEETGENTSVITEEEDTRKDESDNTREEDPEEASGENVTENEEKEDNTEQYDAPAISLSIYEGPLYSEGDDICYYRVVAEVTGDPLPDIEFNRDDSLGSLGKDRAQVNLTRESPSFILEAVAGNPGGKASDTITLNWNCNRPPDIGGISVSKDTLYVNEKCDLSVEAADLDGDPLTYSWSAEGGSFKDSSSNPAEWSTPGQPGDYSISVSVTDAVGNESKASIKVYVGELTIDDTPEDNTPENINLSRKENEGGYIEYGGTTHSGGDIYAGDSAGNKACSGFISFDISPIKNRTIQSAKLTLSSGSVSGDPLAVFDRLWINVLDWGAEPIVQSDFKLAGIAISSYDSPGITCNVSKLLDELQKAVSAGKSRFQIRVHFSGEFTDDDDAADGWRYSQANVTLNVTLD
jgi:hypothetical protein